MPCACTVPKMNLIVIGLPGCGKGTQSKLISDHYGLECVVIGDVLREESKKNTKTGAEIQELMKTGSLFPDELVNKVFTQHTPKENYILDGYPRRLSQVPLCKDIDLVIHIKISEEEAMKRISSRNQGRSDDNEATVKARLDIFKKETYPVIDHYKNEGILETIDGSKSEDDVFCEIKEIIFKKFQV